MAKRMQEMNGSHAADTDPKGAPGLDDLIQQGERRISQQAIKAEWATMPEQYSNVKAMDSRRSRAQSPSAGARDGHSGWPGNCPGTDGSRLLGLECEVQLGIRAALRA
ncbi:hypothetical protein [Burkholderia cepacia]|uniref:hypothetical protein n=1 Tax=Burkholderia cepacia TaxID=292 RepID=UPI000AFE7124